MREKNLFVEIYNNTYKFRWVNFLKGIISLRQFITLEKIILTVILIKIYFKILLSKTTYSYKPYIPSSYFVDENGR